MVLETYKKYLFNNYIFVFFRDMFRCFLWKFSDDSQPLRIEIIRE